MGLHIGRNPISSKIPDQLRGNFRFLNELLEVSVGISFEGSKYVLGTGTPILDASALLKNFSSALHQKGLFITAVPLIAAFFK
jgi:hypothetical protein